jgi:hypothetical protein
MLRLPLSLCVLLASGARPTYADDDPFKGWAIGRLVGTIRDAEGKPIPGAKFHLNNTAGPTGTRGGNWAFTDADGKFVLNVFVKPDGRGYVRDVIVSAKGYVQLHERFGFEEAPILPGKDTELNYVLARGEVLAGKVNIPLGRAERVAGLKAEEPEYVLNVRGPSFIDAYLTEPGGRFEVWVPQGCYTLEVRNGSLRPIRRENVASGSADVVLAPAFARPAMDALVRAFDALWDDMDQNYSHFTVKKVDGKALKERYRPRAIEAKDLHEFVDVLTDMLAELRDGHVWIDFEGRIPTHPGGARGNYNRQVVQDALDQRVPCKDLALVGVTKADGFGVVCLTRQSSADQESVRQVAAFIRAHRDAPGFLVDLREAEGGSEGLALPIAQQFCGKDSVYAKSQFRSGPGHNEFGPAYERVLKAVPNPYLKPVVCLIGPRAVSSGEAFVQMMMCLPNVTTVGARTRGSSGNPKPFKLPGVDVSVWYSRWLDLMPDGTPIEGAGIAPDVAVSAAPQAYREKDPTWEKALDVLREKIGRQGRP